MQVVDLIDAAAELAPRKWKRYAAAALLAAFLLVPNRATDALTWHATEKANRIVTAVLESDATWSTDSPAVNPSAP